MEVVLLEPQEENEINDGESRADHSGLEGQLDQPSEQSGGALDTILSLCLVKEEDHAGSDDYVTKRGTTEPNLEDKNR